MNTLFSFIDFKCYQYSSKLNKYLHFLHVLLNIIICFILIIKHFFFTLYIFKKKNVNTKYLLLF